MMVINEPNEKALAETIEMKRDECTVKPKYQFKILGFVTNNKFNMDSHLICISTSIYNKINSFNKIKKYTSKKVGKYFPRHI